MPLTMTIENKIPACYVVTLNGRLDATTSADCEVKIEPVLVAGTKAVMFDLSNLEYISSMGLRFVLKTKKTVEGYGGSVHIINMQPQIEKVFEIANMLKGFSLFKSVKEADQYFKAMQERVLEDLKAK